MVQKYNYLNKMRIKWHIVYIQFMIQQPRLNIQLMFLLAEDL